MYASHEEPVQFTPLHVGTLAEQANVTPATVRYYSRIGLLSPKREHDNGYRCYSSADLERLEFIRQAQSLGLTISDIKAVLKTVDYGDSPCGQVRKLVQIRLRKTREKIAELHVIEAHILEVTQSWNESGDSLSGGAFCPLIAQA